MKILLNLIKISNSLKAVILEILNVDVAFHFHLLFLSFPAVCCASWGVFNTSESSETVEQENGVYEQSRGLGVQGLHGGARSRHYLSCRYFLRQRIPWSLLAQCPIEN